ncbi:MAG: hypothetical protein EZS28_030216, partial [Streblomastix strix]
MNKEFAALDEYLQRIRKDESELFVNAENMSVDGQFYTKGGRTRKTTSNEFNKSMEVELTEKYQIYRNHINRYITLASSWKWKRQILYNPEDIVIVGVRDPRDPNKRQDIAIAGSGSTTSVASIQSLRDFDGYKTRWNISNIPGPFIRSGI